MPPMQDVPVKPLINLVPEISGKHDVKSRRGGFKKVRFDSNVIAYDPVSYEEEQDDVVRDQNAGKLDNQGNHLTEDGESLNEGSFVAAIAGLYSPSRRYENCRDSDDEFDYWMDSVGSDPEDQVEDSNDFYDDDDEDRDGDLTAHTDEIDQRSYSPNPVGHKTRSRTAPVLRPVENLAQWKALKAKDTRSHIPPVLRPVENLTQWRAVRAKYSRSFIPAVLRPIENLDQWKAIKGRGTRI